MTGPDPDVLEREAMAADVRLLRRVGWRLVAWSGGITLVVLVILGMAIYTAVADSLERSSLARLEARLEQLMSTGTSPFDDSPPLELVMGGASSGTFAFLISDEGQVYRPRFDVPADLPDRDSAEAVSTDAAGGPSSPAAGAARPRDLRTMVVDGVPFRVLSQAVEATLVSGLFERVPITVAQVVEDRSAEQRVLDATLAVLVVGGLVALLVALLAGAIYARRALVPIRQSLAGQRLALRRQREFAADASHELRTPLTIVRASVEDLRLHAGERVVDVGSALEDIDAEVGHLATLVDDLLLLARSDSGALDLTLEPVELGDLATEAAAALEAPASRRGVTIAIDPAPVMVRGDVVRLRQLVTILVDNAVRHSPAGGRIDLLVRSDGRSAVLLVDDQGPGIPAEDLPHVFDRFWRGRHAPRGGTGLGLAIAGTIVTRHGGRIGVANRPEGGARFTVLLPLLAVPAGGARGEQAPAPHLPAAR